MKGGYPGRTAEMRRPPPLFLQAFPILFRTLCIFLVFFSSSGSHKNLVPAPGAGPRRRDPLPRHRPPEAAALAPLEPLLFLRW